MKYSKVLVGGCFNLIHSGHIYFLKEAKKLGDMLVVVLSHDKNNNKPYAVLAEKRKKMFDSLGIADKVIIGDAHDKIKIILKIKPDVIALGYDQTLPEGLADFRCVNIKKLGDHSTRNFYLDKKYHLETGFPS